MRDIGRRIERRKGIGVALANTSRQRVVSRRGLCLVLAAIVITLLASIKFSNNAQADGGNLDQTFGNGGKATTDIRNFNDYAYAVALQPDGKVVVGGMTYINSARVESFLLRYQHDGGLDQSFGNGGRALNIPSGTIGSIKSFVIQPDGKIVGVGGGTDSTGTVGFAIVRYNSDGTPDQNFGHGGMMATSFVGRGGQAQAIAQQPDGKFVVVGTVGLSYRDSDVALARYNSDGSLDQSFGVGGKLTTSFSSGKDNAYAVALQPDGKIVISGDAVLHNSWIDFTIARYNGDGSLDQTFGGGGIVAIDFSFENYARAFSLALQPDGKIVAAGVESSYVAMARFNPDGSLDQNFGSGGKVIAATFGSSAHAVALQPDGKILLAGLSNYSFILLRYDTNGQADQGFGNGGKVLTQFFGHVDEADAMALQPDGNIVVAGSAQKVPYDQYGNDFQSKDVAVARYLGAGAAPPLPPINIAGRVVDESTYYQGLGGVTVTLSGSANMTTQTDANGDYSFNNLVNGATYTVTPSRPGYNFTPTSATFKNIAESESVAFSAYSSCTYSISAPEDFTSAGGEGQITITVSNGCAWQVASNAPWLTLTSASNSVGSGTVTFSVDSNSGAYRTGTLTIAGQTVTVQQKGDYYAPPPQIGPGVRGDDSP